MLRTPYLPQNEFKINEIIALQVRDHVGKITPNKLFGLGKKQKSKTKVILSESWIGTSFWIMHNDLEPRLKTYVTKHANPKSPNRKYVLLDEMSRDEDIVKAFPKDWTEESGYFCAKQFRKTKGSGYVIGETHEKTQAKFNALLWLFFAENDLTLWPAVPDCADKAAWFLIDLDAQVRGIILPTGG